MGPSEIQEKFEWVLEVALTFIDPSLQAADVLWVWCCSSRSVGTPQQTHLGRSCLRWTLLVWPQQVQLVCSNLKLYCLKMVGQRWGLASGAAPQGLLTLKGTGSKYVPLCLRVQCVDLLGATRDFLFPRAVLGGREYRRNPKPWNWLVGSKVLHPLLKVFWFVEHWLRVVGARTLNFSCCKFTFQPILYKSPGICPIKHPQQI